MSIVESLLTTPDGLALVSGLLGLLGFGKVRDRATAKAKQLADAAERLIQRALQHADAADDIAAALGVDPDRAIEVAVRIAAKQLGLEDSEKAIVGAVKELLIRRLLEPRKPELDAFHKRMQELKAELHKPGWNAPFKGEVSVRRGEP
jgi:hypothetical protein